MDKLQRFSLRFLCLAVLFGLCLMPCQVYAETTYVYDTIDTTTGQWEMDYILSEVDENYNFIAELGITSENFSDVTSDLGSYRVNPVSGNMVLNGTNLYHDEIRLFRVDGASLLKMGESFIANLFQLCFDQNAYTSGSSLRRRSNIDFSEVEKFAVNVVSSDGEIATVIEKTGSELDGILTNYDDDISSRYIDIHVEALNMPFDVYQIIIDIYTGADAWNNNNISDLSYTGWNWTGAGTRYFGMYSAGEFIFEVEPKSSEGMIAGIIEWVKKIFDAIVSLPQNIWQFISDGLQDLFVPDTEFLLDYKDDWDELLKEHLGCVYEAVELIDDTAERFLDGGYSSGVIEFPYVRIPVGDDNYFSFGGWDVEILPDKGLFRVLLDALKLIVNAIATFSVIDSLKRRFERLLEQ